MLSIAVVRALLIVLALVVPMTGCSREPTAAPPGQRLVSLTPSATEIVAALGATGDLVGVDEYSTYPAEVGKLPKVGSFLAPNLETIVSLKPTLVIVDDVHGKAAAALGDAHVKTVECPVHDLHDVKAALAKVGGEIGKQREAEAAVAKIEQAIEQTSKPARRPRVLAIIDREANGLGNLIAGGTGSWIDELLAIAGGENVLAAATVRYPKISVEEVLRTKPDIILDLSFAGKADTTPWKSVTQAKVIAISDAYLVAPSPRVAEALAALSKAIR